MTLHRQIRRTALTLYKHNKQRGRQLSEESRRFFRKRKMTMKKRVKYLHICLTAVLGLTLLAGCGQTEKVPEVRETVAPLTSYVTEEEWEAADMGQEKNNAAVAAVMKKAANKEDITIACIGGSITQGTISNGTADKEVGFKKSYVELFSRWWTDTFPETKINVINAGIGATDSYLGVHRVDEDVLSYNPDLVLVEFSVNDAGSNRARINYDNLVRKILLADNHPAVMLLFMGQTNGSNAQTSHALVGFQYGLPMISYCNVIQKMMDDGQYTAKELSGDTTHPSALGHAITGELLWKYLNSVYENCDSYPEPAVFDKPAFTNEKYLHATILPAEDVKVNEPFTVTCSSLGLEYRRTIDGNGGQFGVYVDGEYVGSINTDFSGGWGNYAAAEEIFSADETKEHVVEIKEMEGYEGKSCEILGILISELD